MNDILKPCSLESALKPQRLLDIWGWGRRESEGHSAHGMLLWRCGELSLSPGEWHVSPGLLRKKDFRNIQTFTSFENHFSSLKEKKFQMLPVEYIGDTYLLNDPQVSTDCLSTSNSLTQWKHLFICLAVLKTDFRSPPWKCIWVLKNRAVAQPTWRGWLVYVR